MTHPTKQIIYWSRFIYLFSLIFQKHISSNFAKLYYCNNMIDVWVQSPYGMVVGGATVFQTVVSHNICEQYPNTGTVASATAIWYGSRGRFVLKNHKLCNCNFRRGSGRRRALRDRRARPGPKSGRLSVCLCWRRQAPIYSLTKCSLKLWIIIVILCAFTFRSWIETLVAWSLSTMIFY
jgi:hypothetical protein